MEGLPRDPVHRPRRRAGGRPARVLTAPRRVVLLRHGRTADNASGRIQGQLDTPLDDVGRGQAAAVARVLQRTAPDVVVTSDLARAHETALAVDPQPRVDPRLRELHLGSWQGLTSEQARERYPDQHAAWRAGQDLPRGGGETYAQAGERAAEAVREHLTAVPSGGTLLAVTHGGTARAALGVLLELPQPSWARLVPLGNTCWSVLVEADLGWRLERHNAGVGPLLGAHDLGAQPVGGTPRSPDAEPVR